METPITDGQKFALIKLCSQFTKLRSGRLYLLSELTGRDIKTTSELLLSEWRKIRDEAYSNWHNDDWYMNDEFKMKCKTILDVFEKEVLGQRSLF